MDGISRHYGVGIDIGSTCAKTAGSGPPCPAGRSRRNEPHSAGSCRSPRQALLRHVSAGRSRHDRAGKRRDPQGKCRLSQHSGSGKPAAAQTRPVLLIHDEKLKKSPFMAFMTGPEQVRIR